MLHDVKAGTLCARARNDGNGQNVILYYEEIREGNNPKIQRCK